ncbi:MAG: hypothetical protein JXB30_12325, partial [Anaerolineae bacterium]|nr:hypothetical protein [Anaerolineae bacterium]
GIEWTGGSTAEGYVQVAASHPVGQGIANETLQFHGVADHYRLAGAEAVAWLLSDADTRTDFPSVTVYRYGRGQAALWAFDLARSVAYTRQGNPAWAGQERDGEERIRASDMFKGWVDLDRIAIPQADEQQRLLVNLLSVMNQEKRPLPRLWYFPGAAESVLVATGDSHYNPASAIEDVLSRVEQRQGTMSIYYAPFPTQNPRRAVKRAVLEAVDLPLIGDILASQFTSPGPSHVAEWRARGHEFALHPYVDEVLEEGWLDAWQEFTGVGYGPVSPSVRTHRVLWTGWVETARYQASLGIRMNLDYYHWGAAFQYAEGKWANGHFTGSGRPLRFVDEQGNILNIYQQLTQLTDEQLIDLPWGEGAKMGAEKALEVTQAMLARSVAGNYCAIATNFHVDPFAFGGEWVAEAARLLEGTLDYAAAQNIPILTAVKWLDFTETRDGANLENVQWYASGQRVSFELRTTRDQDAALTVMIPQRHKEIELVQIEIDGVAVEHRRRNVGGMEYGWVVVPAGSHQIVATFS